MELYFLPKLQRFNDAFLMDYESDDDFNMTEEEHAAHQFVEQLADLYFSSTICARRRITSITDSSAT